jgi:hypothetical protein
MSDEAPKLTETVNADPVMGEAKTDPAATASTETEEAKRIADLERQLKNKSEEAARLHRKQQEIEDAKLSETERLQKQLQERETELATLKLNDLKRQTATKFKLPEALALRLQGSTVEELEQDAQELFKALPKPASFSATNPGSANTQGETDAQRRDRLFGGSQGKQNVFSVSEAMKHGGGVYILNKQED